MSAKFKEGKNFKNKLSKLIIVCTGVLVRRKPVLHTTDSLKWHTCGWIVHATRTTMCLSYNAIMWNFRWIFLAPDTCHYGGGNALDCNCQDKREACNKYSGKCESGCRDDMPANHKMTGDGCRIGQSVIDVVLIFSIILSFILNFMTRIHLFYVVWGKELTFMLSSPRSTPHWFERDLNLRSPAC